MRRYTHLFWDFNGTLLNDVIPDFCTANRLLERHGLPKLNSLEEYRNVFHFPVIEYYRALGYDFSKVPYEVLVRVAQKETCKSKVLLANAGSTNTLVEPLNSAEF